MCVSRPPNCAATLTLTHHPTTALFPASAPASASAPQLLLLSDGSVTRHLQLLSGAPVTVVRVRVCVGGGGGEVWGSGGELGQWMRGGGPGEWGRGSWGALPGGRRRGMERRSCGPHGSWCPHAHVSNSPLRT